MTEKSVKKPVKKSRKSKLSVGRTKYRIPVYFWWSESTERRVGWFFPSRKAALRWREHAYWKYAQYPVLEQFLETCPKTMWSRERVWWQRHKDYYLDITLEVGAVEYRGDRFDKKREELNK